MVIRCILGLTVKTAEEQLKMNDCYSDHKDWRTCKREVSGRLGLLLVIHDADSIHRWRLLKSVGRGTGMMRGRIVKIGEE